MEFEELNDLGFLSLKRGDFWSIVAGAIVEPRA